MPYADVQSYEAEQFPFYEGFSIFYTKGWMAVDLFFGLSGFIFYWLYSNKIRSKQVSGAKFALLRFSRLYPLHLATLLVVVIFQLIYKHISEDYFIYPIEDVKRFVLNLFLMPAWKMEDGYPHYLFNGPAWSISVEVCLYVLFFAYCKLFRTRAITAIAFSLIGFVIEENLCAPIGRGIGSFFLGGCVFLAYEAIQRAGHAGKIRLTLITMAVAAWALTVATHQDAIDLVAWASHHIRLPVPFHHFFKDYGPMISKYWVVCVVFPLTILAVANLEKYTGALFQRISVLGNISYSSYLLHFPLQLVISTFVAGFSVHCSVFFTAKFMLMFFGILIGTSWLSYSWFEMPMQRFLRKNVAIHSLGAAMKRNGLLLRAAHAIGNGGNLRKVHRWISAFFFCPIKEISQFVDSTPL